MAPSEELIDTAFGECSRLLGPMDLESPLFAFDFSDYYRREMGQGLKKKFFSFARLAEPDILAGLKRRTAACEHIHRNDTGGRLVHVDPGYWADAKLVLASTQNYSHRIWIGRRIFAEVTLRYHRKRIEPMDWTYPDYRTALALEFFEKVRTTYLKQLEDRLR